MRDKLEELADLVVKEILENGTITVGELIIKPNSLRTDNPFAGLCHAAVSKLQYLAPELNISALGLTLRYNRIGEHQRAHRHIVGKAAAVAAPEKVYIIDPTIGQYVPNAQTVYGPNETYPLKAIPGTIMEFPPNNFL